MSRIHVISGVLVLFLSLNQLFADPPIFREIDDNNVAAVALFLKTNNIDGKYGPDNLTLLAYAVSKNNRRMVKFLLNAGAGPNITDDQQNTPLMYAAKLGQLPMVKLLLRNGAWLNHKNEKWLTAYDIAVRFHHTETSRYLKSRYEKNLPPFKDGPYVAWKNSDRLKAFYLVHDSVRNHTDKIKAQFMTDGIPFIMPAFAYDTNHYAVKRTHTSNPSRYTSVPKLLIIGDIHGGYDSLVLFLRNNGIVDDQLRWIYGTGHIVFLGDIFDRGDKVTEALWLIYQLEQQAMESGGMVHYILGNHEVMVLLEDHRFITDKYYYLCKKLQLTYGHLFSKKTVLGDWLRTKNSIIIIDDKLFVHAGISSEIMSLDLSLDELNERIRYFLKYPERNRKYGLENRELILGMKGPFWYRGFIETDDYYPRFTENQLEAVFNHYDVSSVYIGHSNVDSVSALYDNRVFMLDVPFYSYGFNMQALLIENKIKYLLTTNGYRKPFL
jgi:hypothetical protein